MNEIKVKLQSKKQKTKTFIPPEVTEVGDVDKGFNPFIPPKVSPKESLSAFRKDKLI